MSVRLRPILCISVSLALALFLGCSHSESPTSANNTGTGSLSGTLVSESSAAAIHTAGSIAPMTAGAPLANVTVHVAGTGQSARTDANGNFFLANVPAGSVTLQMDGASVHAQIPVNVAAGSTTAVTIGVSGSSATLLSTNTGHDGEEIEGIVQSVNSGGNSLTVADERLGTVTIDVTSSTIIRHGQTAIPLANIQMGWRVHVKAALQADGTYLASEIIVQDENGTGTGSQMQIEGLVTAVDTTGGTITVNDAERGSVTVTVNSSTIIRHGQTAIPLANIQVGWRVHVMATVQADGSNLASLVIVQDENMGGGGN